MEAFLALEINQLGAIILFIYQILAAISILRPTRGSIFFKKIMRGIWLVKQALSLP
ncbi:hypothetical protein PITCH_A2210004 [uncultured Desulfobacterium sp.]|uniref:Uncharacterized protein n=1 Tax=uncultured Desulfobacterium sp. TaxID=201089 RepID=A0A445MY30_9BACT|nr:hypothetical protein PITCH_A2210004 [uncultured Desulfobacterium sp.]